MAYRIGLNLLDLSGSFSLNLVNFLAAVWFLAVGYLFYKNVNSRLRHSAQETATVPANLLEQSEEALMRG